MTAALRLAALLCLCGGTSSGKLPACAGNAAGWRPYRYLAHAWEATCWIPGTLPIYSDAIVALTAAGSSGGCAAFEGIVGMIDSGGSPFSPGGFGDLANESVPCLVHGNRLNAACPQHCDGCDNGAFTDTKGGFPLGLLAMPAGSRVVHIQGPQRDAILHCYERNAPPGSPKNLSRCADRIPVPECDGQIPATSFAGWEFTLWPVTRTIVPETRAALLSASQRMAVRTGRRDGRASRAGGEVLRRRRGDGRRDRRDCPGHGAHRVALRADRRPQL